MSCLLSTATSPSLTDLFVCDACPADLYWREGERERECVCTEEYEREFCSGLRAGVADTACVEHSAALQELQDELSLFESHGFKPCNIQHKAQEESETWFLNTLNHHYTPMRCGRELEGLFSCRNDPKTDVPAKRDH